MTIVEVLAQLIEHDYVKHRTDRGDCRPERDSYTGRAIVARAERWAKAIVAETSGYQRQTASQSCGCNAGWGEFPCDSH